MRLLGIVWGQATGKDVTAVTVLGAHHSRLHFPILETSPDPANGFSSCAKLKLLN